jgi:folate-binding protein YgfZ
MIADMRVFELGGELLVELGGTLAQTVADRWSKFIFSEDVEVRNISQSTSEVGIYGPQAAAILSAALRSGGDATDVSPASDGPGLSKLPVYANAQRTLRGHSITVLASDEIGVMGFDVVVPAEIRDELVDLLRQSGAVDVSSAAVQICRIEGGRPLFLTDMHEDTIPLEAGIEDRAISLTKGCYVGQEIIIRVLHRGQGRVAKKLVGFSLNPGTVLPSAGATVTAGAREIGSVTSAAESLALGRPIAMGYVHRDFVEPGTLVEIAGASASVAALPFVPVTPLV